MCSFSRIKDYCSFVMLLLLFLSINLFSFGVFYVLFCFLWVSWTWSNCRMANSCKFCCQVPVQFKAWIATTNHLKYEINTPTLFSQFEKQTVKLENCLYNCRHSNINHNWYMFAACICMIVPLISIEYSSRIILQWTDM